MKRKLSESTTGAFVWLVQYRIAGLGNLECPRIVIYIVRVTSKQIFLVIERAVPSGR